MTRLLIAIAWLLCTASLWANPVTQVCPPGTLVNTLPLVPQGAIWKGEHHHPGRATPPPYFHTVISHITVANALSCAVGESKVSIRSWKVYEQVGTSAPKLVQTITFDGKGTDGVGSGGIFPRTLTRNGRDVEQWFGETDGTGESELVYDYEEAAYNVDPGKIARRLFHNWSDPRLDNKPGARYLVEMEVRISGAARLQIGLDWWRGMGDGYTGFDPECQNPESRKNRSDNPANNCEAWMSDWFGDTGGRFLTIRVPKAYWH